VASEVNQKPGETGRIDPRLFLREEELDNGIALLLASERAIAAALRRGQDVSGLNMPALKLLLTIRYQPNLTVSELRGLDMETQGVLVKEGVPFSVDADSGRNNFASLIFSILITLSRRSWLNC